MTDKALVQIPAVYNGVVTKLYYAKGDIAKVHAPLFEMDTEGAAPAVAAPSAPAQQLQPLWPLANSWKTFLLPDIGEGIVECEVVEWLVKEGDVIG